MGYSLCGYVVDFEELLLMVMAILEQEERRRIGRIIKDIQKSSDKMKNLTGKQVEKRPGIVQGMNTESSIMMQMLSMSVQRRQRMLETLTNIIKSAHDAKHNMTRRIV